MPRIKKQPSDTPGPDKTTTSVGSNQPALSYEAYAVQAQKAIRASDRSAIKGATSVIMALVIAHRVDATSGDVDIPMLWKQEGREFTAAANAILYHVFGARQRDDRGNYYTEGSTAHITAAARDDEGQPSQQQLIKAAEVDRVVRALTTAIRRNAEIVAILCKHGGPYHETENPDGCVDVDPAGRIKVRTALWFDDVAAEPGKSLRDAWTKFAGMEMTERQALGWVTLDGTRGFEGPRTIDALRSNARRRLRGPQQRVPRGPTAAERAAEFIRAVKEADARANGSVFADASQYMLAFTERLAQENRVPEERPTNETLQSILVYLLGMYCTEDGELDVDKVRAFWRDVMPVAA